MNEVRSVERLVCENTTQLAIVTVKRIVDVVNEAVAQQGRAVVALAGGRTPREIYDRLALPEVRSRLPLASIQWFWGDERAVPPDHPDSNYRLAAETGLSKSGIDAIHVHRMPADAPKLEAAAATYERLIRATIGCRPDGSTFDLVLLGMGEDGHTVSLFPGAPELDVTDRWVVVTQQEHGGHRRMTLTYPVINHARQIIIVVSGINKAAALAGAMAPDATVQRYPVCGVRPLRGRLLWIADREAISACDPTIWTPAPY